jgi:hypothetical protein
MQSSNPSSLSPIQASPPVGTAVSPTGPRHRRAGSEPYYEDVDPRFAVEEPSDDGYSHHSGIPNALTPGGMTPGAISQGIPGGFPGTPGAGNPQQQYSQYRTHQPPPPPNPEYLHPTYAGAGTASATGVGVMGANVLPSDPNLITPSDPSSEPPSFSNNNSTKDSSSQENLPDGARSPGGGSERASEASHFTSISERPVNPNWRPPSVSGRSGAGSAYGGGGPGPATAQRRREDVILAGNPDFSIPGMGPARGGGRPGRTPGLAASATPGGMTPGGRYPTDI